MKAILAYDEVPEEDQTSIPVIIEITNTPLNKESLEIFLYEIDQNHSLFNIEMDSKLTYVNYKKGGNKFIQYKDELPDLDDSNTYWDDPVRKFIF